MPNIRTSPIGSKARRTARDATSLIGDGVVSCAAMLPGFAYGEANHANADRQRAASIVLATDNVVSGKPTYSLTEALDLTQQTKITVDGLYSGRKPVNRTKPQRI